MPWSPPLQSNHAGLGHALGQMTITQEGGLTLSHTEVIGVIISP